VALRRRHAGESTVEIPINRSIGHIRTNALLINATLRKARLGYATRAWNWTRWRQSDGILIQNDQGILREFYRHSCAGGGGGG